MDHPRVNIGLLMIEWHYNVVPPWGILLMIEWHYNVVPSWGISGRQRAAR